MATPAGRSGLSRSRAPPAQPNCEVITIPGQPVGRNIVKSRPATTPQS